MSTGAKSVSESETVTQGSDENQENAEHPAGTRDFSVEGPAGALRISYNDLDLHQLMQVDSVTADCVERMPMWLRALNGQIVRLRGYMRPSIVMAGISAFIHCRHTGLENFAASGKIYDRVTVTLNMGTTTDYIENDLFDVVGKLRIEVLQLEEDDPESIWGLYYIDDAVIIRK